VGIAYNRDGALRTGNANVPAPVVSPSGGGTMAVDLDVNCPITSGPAMTHCAAGWGRNAVPKGQLWDIPVPSSTVQMGRGSFRGNPARHATRRVRQSDCTAAGAGVGKIQCLGTDYRSAISTPLMPVGGNPQCLTRRQISPADIRRRGTYPMHQLANTAQSVRPDLAVRVCHDSRSCHRCANSADPRLAR
jgi:hypothetical protein